MMKGVDWQAAVRPLIVLVLIGAVVWLALNAQQIPEFLIGLASTLTTWLFKDRSDGHVADRITAALYEPPPGASQMKDEG